MTSTPARARAAALLVSLLVLLTALPARADPWTFEKDKTDNDFYFTYDAASGTMPKAYSSARFNARDKVTFLVYVREHEGAMVGERLNGRLELALAKKQVVIYDGTFTLEVLSSMSTDPIYTASRAERIVLRPKKGSRKTSMTFPLDLPSGDYSARATFAAG
jgi:hypothetical protein